MSLRAPVPESVLRESALALVTDAESRSALRWLGEALHERLVCQPTPPSVDRSLAPELAAVASDLRYLCRLLRRMDPRGEPCDVTRAAFAERAAVSLELLARSLESLSHLRPPAGRPPPSSRFRTSFGHLPDVFRTSFGHLFRA
ncbi:MAG: hypothetical protein AAF604_17945 [Acidobacteriota bacterium]